MQSRFLGEIPYNKAWEWQRKLREQRIQGLVSDTLLLLEHPPTITLGRLRGESSLLSSLPVLEQKGIEVIQSDRGGDATLHSPGQLVGYCVFDLNEMGIKLPELVEKLALCFQRILQKRGIEAYYDTKYPGLWVGNNKIVAFGFHLKSNVTMHGFAFNICNDLSLFHQIVPCGLSQKGVTSLRFEQPLQEETPESIAIEVQNEVTSEFSCSLEKWEEAYLS